MIDEIHQTFQEGNRVIYLEGMGGIGKSELAKQYAVKFNDSYETVLFVSYTSDLKSIVCDSRAIEIEGLNKFPDEDENTFFQRKMRVFRTLTSQKTLVILDNYDIDYDPDLDSFLEGDFRIIITSRNSHTGNKTIHVKAITDNEMLFRIFEENYGSDLDTEDIPALLKLFEIVEHHTYTIELLAKQMEASCRDGQEMLDLFCQGRLKDGFSETVIGHNDRKTAFEHIRTIFSTSNLSNEEQQIMRVLSLIGIEGIQANRLKEWASLTSFETVNRLVGKSWVRREHGKKFSLHPLVIEVVHFDLHPDIYNCRDFLDKIGDFTICAWLRPIKENISVRDNILSLLNYFSPFDIKLWHGFEPTIGYLWQVAKFSESIRHMESLYNSAVSAYGQANMITDIIAKAIGGCYFNANRLSESVYWYNHGLNCMLNSGAPLNQDVALAYEKVGRCYTWECNQNFAKAEQYFNLALNLCIEIKDKFLRGEIVRGIHPANKNTLSAAWGAIGSVYLELGRMKQLLGNYREALRLALLCKENYLKYQTHSPSSIAYALFDEGCCRLHIGTEEFLIGHETLAIQEWEKAEDSLLQSLQINLHMRGEFAFDTIRNQEKKSRMSWRCLCRFKSQRRSKIGIFRSTFYA